MASIAAAGAGAGNGGHAGASAAAVGAAAPPAVGVPGTLPSAEVMAAAASKQQQAKASVLTSDYIKSAIRDVVGGTMGGFGLVAIGHPFDTMKVRLQTQPAHAPLYSGLIDCVQQTMRREGVRGFYSGVFSPLCGQMFLNATQFFSWGQSSAMVSRHTGRKPENFELEDFAVAGLMTALACAVVESPIDFFKSQLQVQVFRQRAAAAAAAAAATGVAAAVGATAAAAATAATRTTAAVAGGAAAAAAAPVSSQPAFHTVPQAFKYVLKNYGIRGAYQGLSATILRNVPFRSLYFGAYATTRELLIDGDPTITREKTPTWVQLVSGGMAGLTQWFVCYPLDVIKSTMQTDAIPRHERKYKGWLDTVRKLYATGGVRMFFRGWTPCMLRSFPANAVCYWLYEKTVHTLERKM